MGGGGRKLRTDAGDCWDNFNVVFTYPDHVQVSFGSTQFDNPAFDAATQFFGDEGQLGGALRLPGQHRRSRAVGRGPWPGAREAASSRLAGTFKGSLDQAESEKQKAFVESITGGEFHNQAAQGAESALSAMLGRTAAYTGKLVTWDELMKSRRGIRSEYRYLQVCVKRACDCHHEAQFEATSALR